MTNRNNLPQAWRNNAAHPFREFNRLQRNLDRLFDEFWTPMTAPTFTEEGQSVSPPCDVEEREDHYFISLDIPGVHKDQLRIEMRDQQLWISGERSEIKEHTEREGRTWGKERFHGTFNRVITLPSTVNPEKIEALYENGVLQIAIPKVEESKSKLIPIREQKTGIFNKLLGHPKDTKNEKVA